MQGAQLWHVDFQDANLQYAQLQGAQFDNVNFQNADLRGANLGGVRLEYYPACVYEFTEYYYLPQNCTDQKLIECYNSCQISQANLKNLLKQIIIAKHISLEQSFYY